MLSQGVGEGVWLPAHLPLGAGGEVLGQGSRQTGERGGVIEQHPDLGTQAHLGLLPLCPLPPSTPQLLPVLSCKSFSKCLLSPYTVRGNVLGLGNFVMDKVDKTVGHSVEETGK